MLGAGKAWRHLHYVIWESEDWPNVACEEWKTGHSSSLVTVSMCHDLLFFICRTGWWGIVAPHNVGGSTATCAIDGRTRTAARLWLSHKASPPAFNPMLSFHFILLEYNRPTAFYVSFWSYVLYISCNMLAIFFGVTCSIFFWLSQT